MDAGTTRVWEHVAMHIELTKKNMTHGLSTWTKYNRAYCTVT